MRDWYRTSQLLLARAGFDGSLQLLTGGWERALGYRSEELVGKTLLQLMGFDWSGAAAAVAAILDDRDLQPVDVQFRCSDGLAKGFRLHRHYDRIGRAMYIVAEETAQCCARASSLLA
jgi:PAS domain-containing protein